MGHGRKFSLWALLKELLDLECVEIRMWGDEEGARTYRYFIRLHPRYKIIRNKAWGVALIPLPDTFEEYLRGKDKQALRTNRRRAFAEGYYFDEFSPLEHLQEMLDINRSKPIRQGKPMAKTYIEEQELIACLEKIPSMFGVFNAKGLLRAYAYVPVYGEVAVVSRLLGHGDDLEKGIMYLLLSEIIRYLIELKNKQGVPKWIMYDTFFGALPGLRYFKERMGFKPYRVRWSWCSKCSKE
ncbi:MAG: hypothetical protein ACPLTR_00025 [Thermacetogeniaceae bacterium]